MLKGWVGPGSLGSLEGREQQYLYRSVERRLPVSRELLGWQK